MKAMDGRIVIPKSFLFLTAVHGDEEVGVEVLRKLESEFPKGSFDWVIANEQAYRLKKRFKDADLNRVAPGAGGGHKYEASRALDLVKLARQYSWVIDVHGSVSRCGIFIIVTNPTDLNLYLASRIPVRRVVIWEPDYSIKTGPLTKFMKRGIAIECGLKDCPKIKCRLLKILRAMIKREILGHRLGYWAYRRQRFFRVYGRIPWGEVEPTARDRFKDFRKINFCNERFYPLLVGQYLDSFCYRMKEISNPSEDARRFGY